MMRDADALPGLVEARQAPPGAGADDKDQPRPSTSAPLPGWWCSGVMPARPGGTFSGKHSPGRPLAGLTS